MSVISIIWKKKSSNASIRTQSIMAYSHHYLGIPWVRRGVLRDGEEADFITFEGAIEHFGT